ncbi:MAG: hypothetical protein M0D57_08410 [Sphingobacteriales bacterium JAD_PAG50586_3]|nr:MAG: hypothetical protein M0D57_08410 [Sphingobacteriales bacterium JAD_PAG50586_3]
MRIFLLFFLFAISTTVIAQKPKYDDLKKRGIVYTLTVLKFACEAKLNEQLTDGATANDAAANATYSTLKMQLDAALNQFDYELNRKNGLRCQFDKINKRFKVSGDFDNKGCAAIKDFKIQLSEYIKVAEDFTGLSNKAALVDPLAVIDLAWGIFKDIHDIGKEKADGLKTILDGVRLAPPKDIK